MPWKKSSQTARVCLSYKKPEKKRIKENVWQLQQQKMLCSFAENKKGKEREKW